MSITNLEIKHKKSGKSIWYRDIPDKAKLQERVDLINQEGGVSAEYGISDTGIPQVMFWPRNEIELTAFSRETQDSITSHIEYRLVDACKSMRSSDIESIGIDFQYGGYNVTCNINKQED